MGTLENFDVHNLNNSCYRITKELFESKNSEIIEFFKKNIAKYNRN